MGGRMRELCCGINVDLGTAATFREQWAREAGPVITATPQSLLLRTLQAPGDAVAITAAIYSLHRAHPGKYTTAVESSYPEVFEHNPDVVVSGVAEVQMHYPAIHKSNDRGIHFMQGWCEFLGSALGISIPLLTDRPRLYFDTPSPPIEDFWLVCSGGKRDFTNKLWGGYQEVVNKSKETFVQVGGGPRLNGVVDMVDKTTLRELFSLARRCKGILCGVSLLMHVAAALEKPSVVIAGGREPVQWNAYPLQQYVHTVGMLPCRSVQGHVGKACWRSRVIPLGDGSELDKDTCEFPTNGMPKCMTLIRPESILELIQVYPR